MSEAMSDAGEKSDDCNQPKDDQMQRNEVSIKISNNVIDEMEEPLGSVTKFPPSGNDGPAVRTSARVIHKLRTPVVPPEKKEAQNEAPVVNAPKTPSQPKVHVRVQWINAERNYFFDALNEYGRDFEQISRYINAKMRRKTPTEQDYKTKDNIRQMYYQMYQKASKYLRFSDDVKKHAQELYTIINYGEMKRKLVMGSEKSFLKFRDLVYKGSVTIRLKGKNIKVKTPSCRALRKLNQLEGNAIEDIHLPQRLDVVLRPLNIKSWGFVHGLAQNPRIQMVSLPLQKRLATLLHTLQQKWHTTNSRLYERYVNIAIQKNGPQRIGEDIVAQSKIDLVQLKNEQPMLRFMPPHDTVIHRPMVQLNELLSSCNICLNSYEDRIGATTRGETLSTEKFAHIKDLLKHPSKRMRFDSASDKNAKAKVEEQNKNAGESKLSEEPGITVIVDKSNDAADSDMKTEIKEENIESKVKQSLDEKKDEPEEALQIPTAPIKDENDNKPAAIPTPAVIPTPAPTSTTKSKKKDLMINGHKSSKEHQFKPLIDEETLKKVRKGWTMANVGDLTIGDLYLMFGTDSRLVLEYDFVDRQEVSAEANAEATPSKVEPNDIGKKLKNLLTVANLMEGSTNPMLLNFLSNHACDRSTSDSNHAEPTFKQPILNNIPRIKSNQQRWWLQHRPRGIGNQVMVGTPSNHVIRDLYQTPPPPVESQQNKKACDKVDRDDEVTKILEQKIQTFQNVSGRIEFPENSRASMRSILENLMSNNDRPRGPVSDGELRKLFWRKLF